MANEPRDILETAYLKALANLEKPFITDPEIASKVEYLARLTSNKAGARFILSCSLAKTHNSSYDIRKPYTEIGQPDAFSGRTSYDEDYVANFIQKYELPLNPTTPWLTPGFRVKDQAFTMDLKLVGRPKRMYKTVLELLDDVQMGRITSENLMTEMIRWLIIIREERRSRMESLKASFDSSRGETSLSVDAIINLISQHLKLKNTARLPVLIVAAAYNAAQSRLGEKILPLEGHNAADKQTGSLGDLEITLINEDQIITSYEMKKRLVTKLDIDHAIMKVIDSGIRIDNYIFITTEPVDNDVYDYANAFFDNTGIEVVILDCISFLKHFLYLFYRIRLDYLEAYQDLLLNEPESAVNQPLKEAFLSMRQAAESVE